MEIYSAGELMDWICYIHIIYHIYICTYTVSSIGGMNGENFHCLDGILGGLGI
jgi:hypothetical protein